MRWALGLYLAIAAAYYVLEFRPNARVFFDKMRSTLSPDRSIFEPGVFAFGFALFLIAQVADAMIWPWHLFQLARLGREDAGGGDEP
jgi:hypothetical protein